jgi:hypothetical protein
MVLNDKDRNLRMKVRLQKKGDFFEKKGIIGTHKGPKPLNVIIYVLNPRSKKQGNAKIIKPYKKEHNDS